MRTSVFLNGTVGAGKSTTADAMSEVLGARGIRHGVIDLDHLRRLWPAPTDDPFAHELELANLAAVMPNFRAAGVERMILAGVIEDPAERPRYEHALGGRLTIVRLTAAEEVLRTRLIRRHDGSPAELKWYLGRVGELAEILQRADGDDVVVDTSGAAPADVADRILSELGW